MAQSPDGTFWIASSVGLFRFDGLKFYRYGDAGEPALASGNISNIAVTQDGSVWISPLFGGLDRIKNGQIVHYLSEKDVPRGTVRSVAEDRDGVIWAAANGGVARLVADHWERVGKEWDMPVEPATDIVLDARGNLWIRTFSAEYMLPRAEKKFRRIAQHAVSDIWRQGMAADSKGAVWTYDEHLNLLRHSPSGKTVGVTTARALDDGPLLIDRDGVIWMGGSKGVHRFKVLTAADDDDGVALGARSDFDKEQGLSASYALALLEDREGNVWVATSGGLDRFSHTDINRVALPRSGSYLSITPGAGGDVYVGAGLSGATGSIFRLHQGTVDKEWPGPIMMAVHRAPDGSNWFAGQDTLVHRVGEQLSSVDLPTKESMRPAQSVVTDASGAAWVSVAGIGTFKFEKGAWTKASEKSLARGTAICAERDQRDRVWFGFIGGATVIDHGTDRAYGVADGLDLGPVTAIHSRAAHLWFGGERGIAHLEGERFVALKTAQVHLLSGIAGIAEDKLGGLWAATYSSVVHVPPAELAHALADPSYEVKADAYDHLDGMPGLPRQLRPTPSLVLADDGKIWVATDSTVVYFDPAALEAAAVPPPITVGPVAVDDRPFDVEERAGRLPLGMGNLQIDYDAWSLSMPERVRFRYRLDGVDDGWQEAGPRRAAFYSHIPPGTYTFHVAASKGHGEWGEAQSTLTFVMPAAWYQTWWFRSLCIAAVIAFLRLLYLWRVAKRTAAAARLIKNQLEERLDERERIARELHDTLLQSTQGLILSFQGAVSRMPKDNQTRGLVETALDRAEEVLSEARDRVRDLRTSGGEDVELCDALREAGHEMQTERPVQCTATRSGMPVSLVRRVRDETYRVAREAMLNAFQHAHAQAIRIEVSYAAKGLVVCVTDDGSGIDEELLERGARVGHWGLLGMRERAQRISATFEITSHPDEGTSVRIEVPASVAYDAAGSSPNDSKLLSPREWWRQIFSFQG